MNTRLPDLRAKTAKLTTSPGVYLMKNQKGQIIYVGKAKNLKNRVTSYFRVSAEHTPKVASMVEHVYDYDFIVTDSEYEALVLECSLIKQHQPRYNILLKDDKGYSYLCFSAEPYPRLTAEKNKTKKGEYLGPYMSGYITRETARETNRVFRLPTCHKRFPEDFGKTRPCLNYHIHQCMGVCRGNISEAEYAEQIRQAKSYIQMGSVDSVKRMQKEMEQAAESLDFERAAMLRDRIAAVKKAGETQKILDATFDEADVLAMAEHRGMQCISILRYRNRRLFDKEVFFFSENVTREELMESYISQYYEQHRSEIPKNILLEFPLSDPAMYEQLLQTYAQRKIRLNVPQRGSLCQYVQLSKNNANEELALRFGRTGKEVQALEELGQVLGLPKAPQYIEAYDISNLSSSSMVCGMVVFENGRPLKRAYKRFRMKEHVTQDDYACMQEAITRRLRHYVEQDEAGFSRLPDLILLDGGTGHVHAIAPILEQFGVKIPLYGMVKDQKHRTRAISGSGGEISLSANRAAFHLLTQIQDEVHRFSVAYMHRLHAKSSYQLELTKVRGIGEKKAQKLLLHYKTLAHMKQASAEELASVAGVSLETAEALYEAIQSMTGG